MTKMYLFFSISIGFHMKLRLTAINGRHGRWSWFFVCRDKVVRKLINEHSADYVQLFICVPLWDTRMREFYAHCRLWYTAYNASGCLWYRTTLSGLTVRYFGFLLSLPRLAYALSQANTDACVISRCVTIVRGFVSCCED